MQDIFTNIKSDMWLLLVGGGGVEYFFSDFQIRSTDFFFFFTNFTAVSIETPTPLQT
jgi:hypothetical protein